MRKMLTLMAVGLTLGASAAATAPAFASNACERDKHDAKVGGTLLGALGGAVVGSAVAGRGNKTGGVLLGAAGGAVVGNQLARSKRPCPSGYHANPLTCGMTPIAMTATDASTGMTATGTETGQRSAERSRTQVVARPTGRKPSRA